MQVRKRSGELNKLDLSKISESITYASKNVENVSISDIEITANLHFYNEMDTSEIHLIVEQAAKSMISLKTIGYETVFRNLILQRVYKEVYKGFTPKPLVDMLKQNIGLGVYRSELLSEFNESELEELSNEINHDNDLRYFSAGVEMLIDKYLIHYNGKLIESPQLAFMAIAMDAFRDYTPSLKMFYIKSAYHKLSQSKISLPTPMMNMLRTTGHNYASCVTIKFGDNIDSWCNGISAVMKHTVANAGIGVDISSVASLGDKVKNGTITHSGKIPLMRLIDAAIQTTSQHGRRGQAVTYVNLFDPEIETILSIKSPRIETAKRINDLKHGIKMNRVMYQRAINDEMITLISKRDCPELYELMDSSDIEQFEKVYIEAELKFKDNKKLSARELFEMFVTERFETGVYYVLNIDEANRNKTYKDNVSQSNICVEFISPTSELKDEEPDSPDIGICVLSNINQGTIGIDELPETTDVLVRMLNHIKDRQIHPTPQANAFVKDYGSLGIGIANHAYFIANNECRFGSEKALRIHNEWMEHFQYNLIQASVNVAKEFGPCKLFHKTTYSEGVMPIDRYNKNVDTLRDPVWYCDWDRLRQEVLTWGMANAALSMIPPSETSSIHGGMTSGMEPIKELLTIKGSKTKPVLQLAPEAIRLADKYDYSYDRHITSDYIKHVAIAQSWICQSTSANTFYNPLLNKNEKVSQKMLLSDIFLANYLGCKTLYYNNVYVEGEDDISSANQCFGGGCSV